MAQPLTRRPAHLFLTDAEIEEFRVLAREHAGAELTADEARTVADQLLRVLTIVRSVALGCSSVFTWPVDKPLLPESGSSAINSNSSPT